MKSTRIAVKMTIDEFKQRYQLLQQIGHGSFGIIFAGIEKGTGRQIAIKIESSESRYPQLQFEYQIYKTFDGAPGFVHATFYGKVGGDYYMIMERLSKNLEELFILQGKKFSLRTVLLIAIQMINRLKYFHSWGLMHRDLKPENIMIREDHNDHELYLIDFGLAKQFRDPITNLHIELRTNRNLTGTMRYSSQNAHRGLELSRRDDLESLGYILVYFLHGRLPWQGLLGSTREQKYQRVTDRKLNTSLEEVCLGLPTEFLVFLRQIRGLSFTSTPDYDGYCQMFRTLYIRHRFPNVPQYDWEETLYSNPSYRTSPSQSEIVPPSQNMNSLLTERSVQTGNTNTSTAGQYLCADSQNHKRRRKTRNGIAMIGSSQNFYEKGHPD